MKNHVWIGLLTTLMVCTSPGTSSADDIKELVTLKGKGAPVKWIALSADGSRLAVAENTWMPDKQGRMVRVPTEAVVWDVASGSQLCTCKNPKARFEYVLFSADAKTLVTVDGGMGYATGAVKVHEGLRTSSRNGYQAWDSTTGRQIGSPIAPAPLGQFTAAAVSPDGKYLATVFNEQVTGASVPLQPFKVRQVTVWDLQEHRVKWMLPGSSHQGRVIWSDSLAFSPDGKRLAVYMTGSGGPSSEAASAPPDRRNSTVKSLMILTLENGKDAPTVAVLKRPLADSGELEWLPGGKFLVAHDGRTIETINPTTGQGQGAFTLPFPTPEPPKPSANRTSTSAAAALDALIPRGQGRGHKFPLPPPGPGGLTRQPEGWFEPQIVLSANGARIGGPLLHQQGIRKQDAFHSRSRGDRAGFPQSHSHLGCGRPQSPGHSPVA